MSARETRPNTEDLAGRTRLRPELRRAQLIDCALAAAAEHGIARVTHSHVAARAGVSIPAVHSYFRSREDLVEAILAEVEAYVLRIVDETLHRPGAPYDRLHLLATRFAQDALDRPSLIVAWLDWSTGVRAAHWPRYLRAQDQVVAWTAEVLREAAGDPPMRDETALLAAARTYIGGGHTVALMQFAGAAPDELAQLIDRLVSAALAG